MFLNMIHLSGQMYLMDLSCGSIMFHGYNLILYLGESKSVLNREIFCVLLKYKKVGKIKYLYGA